MNWHAIVIGTDAYPAMPSAQLQGCVNDARSIYDFLVDKVAVPPARITLLTSPAADPDRLSSAANIRAALDALTGAARAGDHAVLYYACHGVRLVRANADASRNSFYGLAAADISRAAGGFANLILDREINRFLRQLQRRQVSVTVIADTCHSGASTRDVVSVRALKDIAPLSAEEWQALVTTHPALAGAPDGDGAEAPPAERVAQDAEVDADFVVLAACQDTETAKEDRETIQGPDGTQTVVQHGALTRGLLDALRKVPAGQVPGLRWADLYDDVSRTVSARVSAMGAGPQRPALEGDPARPVFGGAWVPFAPGFTVRRVGAGLTLDGGTLHGLDAGARIDLFPSDTTDFDAAAQQAVPAVIETAQLSSSTARLVDPASAARVADKSRARLIRPGPAWPPMLVRFVDVPQELLQEVGLDTEERQGFVALAAPGTPAHLEVRPFIHDIPASAWGLDPTGGPSEAGRYWQGARGGFVLVRSDVAGAPSILPDSFDPTPEDVIAYLPGAGPQVERLQQPQRRLGSALGRGLVYYARYLRTRDRSGGDQTMRAMLGVKLRAGRAADAPAGDDADQLPADLLQKTVLLSSRAGIYEVAAGDWLFLEVKTLRPTALRLYVGVVLCSDDGNVYAVWPPEGERFTFDPGTTTCIGKDRFNPLFLNTRPDQATSRWTLKLIAYTAPEGSDPINLQCLEQTQAVQDLFAEDLQPTRATFGRPLPQPEKPAWYAWDLRIDCRAPG